MKPSYLSNYGKNLNKKKVSCPRCHLGIDQHQWDIVYKDVLECTNCGYIWIAQNTDVLEKYLIDS